MFVRMWILKNHVLFNQLSKLSLGISLMMIQLQINQQNPICLDYLPSQSINSLYTIEDHFRWEKTYDKVNPEQPVWEVIEKYGTNWKWITGKLVGGSNQTGSWFVFIIAIILWLIFLGTGLMPFVSQYYAIAIENVMKLIDKIFIWLLGPEDPFIYIIRRIVAFFSNIVGFLTLVGFVWYLTAVWCYLPYEKRYNECQANYMRRFFGGIIAVMYVFFYYSWGFGISFLNSLRSLDHLFLIGPLMKVIANIGQWIYNKLRVPSWIPIYGQFILGYFQGIESGMPYLIKALEPIELAVDDTNAFLDLTQQSPVIDLTRQYNLDKFFESAKYQYKTDSEKAEDLYDRSQKITSRFMQWTLITIASVFGGGLNILRKACADSQVKELQEKLFKATIDKGMDETARKSLITKIQYQITLATKRPKLDQQCLINTIETATLAGHATIFWGIIIFVIFLFFKPPSPR